MTIDTLAAYVGNGIGIALLLVLFLSNAGAASKVRESKELNLLLLFSATSCISDIIAFSVDGKAGLFATVCVYFFNSWMYLANMLTGLAWVCFISAHIGFRRSKLRDRVYAGAFGIGVFMLALNLFYPVVFSVKENVYHREFLYWIFVAIDAGFIIDSLKIYIQVKIKGGLLTFFPVYIFVLPVIIGTVLQSCIYGLSLIWPSVAIGAAGVMTAMKNELLYTDRLTGIYNRFYLEQLQKRIVRQKNADMIGIMADLNDFKSINDRFGHAVGDEALILASKIFVDAAGEYGAVTRYAGDEFVILLNSVDEWFVQQVIKKINNAFEDFNKSNDKPYKLSASMGYAIVNLGCQSISDFMNTIDSKMYENKLEYYKTHTKTTVHHE